MSNMSYCRFENTYHDLLDCEENWDSTGSESEKDYQEKLLELCQEIVKNYGE